MAPPRLRAAVVVLGDLGRSPRMQYHALALAEDIADVDLIGLAGTPPIEPVARHARIRCHVLATPLPAGNAGASRARQLIVGAARALVQTVQLGDTLLRRVARPDLILVQSPPAIPTLPIAWMAARCRSAKLIVDWHNFGDAILALKFGAAHPAVRVVRWFEHVAGRRADGHLCVSNAMREELRRSHRIDSTVMHDRPGPLFEPQAEATRATVRARVGVDDGGRPRPLVVTSTSWTPDEDFELLLAAASRLDQRLGARDAGTPERPHPGVSIVITGLGPLRTTYERRLAALGLRRVTISLAWLSWDEYRRLLGAADLGLCLHRSASGVDLPMKIQDMFGAGLPVCALDYGPCLGEVARHGENALLFRTADELADQLYDLFHAFPAAPELLAHLRRTVRDDRAPDWLQNWRNTAAPLFER